MAIKSKYPEEIEPSSMAQTMSAAEHCFSVLLSHTSESRTNQVLELMERCKMYLEKEKQDALNIVNRIDSELDRINSL